MGDNWSDVASERSFASSGGPMLSLDAMTANYALVKPELAKFMYFM